MKVYNRDRLLGRFVSAQPFNGRLLVIYLDNDRHLTEVASSPGITVHRNKLRMRMYKVNRSLKSRIKYEISKRFSKNRS